MSENILRNRICSFPEHYSEVLATEDLRICVFWGGRSADSPPLPATEGPTACGTGSSIPAMPGGKERQKQSSRACCGLPTVCKVFISAQDPVNANVPHCLWKAWAVLPLRRLFCSTNVWFHHSWAWMMGPGWSGPDGLAWSLITLLS